MIRLNLSTDYALRTLLLLASRPLERLTVGDIAAFYGISADHVGKVAGTMVRAGWLRGERGRTGGLQLAVSPSRLSVGDVVEHFEGKIALLECVHHRGVCVIEPVCRLRCVLAAAGDRLVRDLKQVTLDRLAGTDTGGLLQLGEEEGDRRPMRHGHSPNSPHGTRGRRER